MIHDQPPWEELERRGPDSVDVDGVLVRPGSVVRLAPRQTGSDIFEVALAGRTALVHEVLEDYEGRIQLAVVVADDPGQDLGALRRPGHRFFFDPHEVEPLHLAPASPARERTSQVVTSEQPSRRVLVAGIGNVFLGDDGWGVALAGRLAARALPRGVDVVDFGIRGMDLAYAMQDDYDTVVFLDATPRGEPPGTLYVIEPDIEAIEMTIDAHGMDPVKVLALARTLGAAVLPRTLIVGCEPQTHMSAEDEHIIAELTEPVRASLDEAVVLVENLLADLATPQTDITTSEQGKGLCL
ncbi:MAG TPA: hydrogenase maturation protease [Solirubrobacteraceae bacterium]|jgi:hydrogenase maturation protease|nr:hydrogenase maturation protease [Solirubrobacteraceae bacterium]